jgi:hypothetical protein
MKKRVSRLATPVMLWATLGVGCSASTSSNDATAGSGGVVGAAGSTAGASGAAGSTQGAAGSDSAGAAGTVSGGAAGEANVAGGGSGGEVAGGGVAGATGGGGAGGASGGAAGAGGASLDGLEPFSFFVTSQVALISLAPDENGFGGDLRFGEQTGLAGADKICSTIAETSMPGSSAKQWRAFLSATSGGENDGAVNAIDRIGEGPWYDRNGRVIAMNIEGLLGVRPDGDAQAVLDLPNETGEPNHSPGGVTVDNHDTLTGSNAQGELDSTNSDDTCADWTRNDAALGSPRLGHSWPRNAGNLAMGGHWMSDHNAQGCLPKVNTNQDGGGPDNCDGVGCGGGYGGIYCFALNP